MAFSRGIDIKVSSPENFRLASLFAIYELHVTPREIKVGERIGGVVNAYIAIDKQRIFIESLNGKVIEFYKIGVDGNFIGRKSNRASENGH